MTKPTLQDQRKAAEERLIHDIAHEQLPPEEREAFKSEYQRVADDPKWWALIVNATRARQDVAMLTERLVKAQERQREAEAALEEAVTRRINALTDE